MKREAATAAVAVLIGGCATPPPAPESRESFALGAVTTKTMPLDDVNRECERRMGNAKPHWGCATFDRSTRACEILAQPLRDRLDFDRAAVLGFELDNCNRMAAGR